MRYFLGFLIAMGLITLAVILVIKGSHANNAGATPIKPLSSYATSDSVASLTTAGPIVADQNHNEIQINVSSTYSQINIIRGYQGTVVNTESFPNNEPAYEAFLSALSLSGFNLGNSNYKYKNPIGYCSFGETFTYSLVNDGNSVENYWTTSCGGGGSFKGNIGSVNALFIAQIPTYSTLTSNVSL